MRGRLLSSHALALGIVCAVAGFCYGVSTVAESNSQSIHEGAGGRAVGTGIPLRFTNPLVPPYPSGEYDLGDAAYDSTITRYITAEGGLRPYRFTSFGTQSLQNVIAGTKTTLQLGLSGVLAGSVPGQIGAATRTITGAPGFRFLVSVQDSKGTAPETRTAFFNLFLIDARNLFKFATAPQLPDARLGTTYISKIDAIGGSPTLTFSVLSVAGPGVANSDQLGLYVTATGTVVGRPLATGTFTIGVRCTDSRGRLAQNRAQTTFDQTFSINVNPNPVSSSDLATISCVINGKKPNASSDTLSYTGFVNVLGQDNFSLVNSDFSFQVAGLGFSGRLDKNGKLTQTLQDSSKIKVSLSTKTGLLKVTIRGGNFATQLGASTLTAGTVRKPLQVTLGDAIAESEVLDFVSKVSADRYTLTYGLGKNGSNASGAFQILSVKGKDGNTQGGLPGDAWMTSFLAIPRNGVIDPSGKKPGLDGVTGVTVNIGTTFTQNFSGADISSSSGNLALKGDKASGVRGLKLNLKSFKGTLTTNQLSTKTTGIPQAVQSPSFGSVYFALGVSLVRGTGLPFAGEHARHLFGLGNKWSDSPPSRVNHIK